MKNYKSLFVLSLIIVMGLQLNAQSVGVSSAAITPDASSIFEVRATDKGLLIPRVALTSATDVATIASPATSLLVYNTATAGIAPNDVSPGYYYWDGAKWVKFFIGAESEDWTLLGNAGTNPATNFLGTTDAQNLSFRTSNNERARLESTGELLIGPGGAVNYATAEGDLYVQDIIEVDNDIYLMDRIFHGGDTDTYWDFDTDQIFVRVGNVEMMRMIEGGSDYVVFNEGGLDVDFRIECEDETDLFYINGDGEGGVFINQIGAISGDIFSVYSNEAWNGSNPWAINAYNSYSTGGSGFFSNSNASNGYNAMEGSTNGTYSGVFGLHIANSGAGYGVYGTTNSASGIGVVASNTAGGIAAYFNVGGVDCLIDYSAGEPTFIPTSANWGYVGTAGNYWYYMYSNNYVNVSERNLKRDINPIDDNEYALKLLMNDIDNMKPSFYKYKNETDVLEEGNESKYRPNYHIGLILDETPDYLQDNTFSGVDIYALATLGILGVKSNLNSIQKMQEKINDFGVNIIDGQSVWVEYSNEFVEKLNNNSIPVVTITPIGADVVLFISEVNSQGFKVESSSDLTNITFNWIAMAKVNAEEELTNEYLDPEFLKQLSVPDSEKEKMHIWGKKNNENATYYENKTLNQKEPLKTKQNINDLK